MDRKGFTLVELIAVIVLLAVIALIASPIILNLVGDSQEGALKTSINGVKKAMEQDYGDNGFKTGTKYNYGGFTSGNFDASTSTKKLIGDIGGTEREVLMSGAIDGKGKGIIDSNGAVKLVIFTENYCGSYGVNILSGSDENAVQVKKYDSTFTKEKCIDKINSIY